MVCNEKDWEVPEATLCRNSEFFRACLKHSFQVSPSNSASSRSDIWKERDDKHINLPEDDADAVEVVLHFMHCNDLRQTRLKNFVGPGKAALVKSVLMTAEKLLMPNLKSAIIDMITSDVQGGALASRDDFLREGGYLIYAAYSTEIDGIEIARRAIMESLTNGAILARLLEDEKMIFLMPELPNYHIDLTKALATKLLKTRAGQSTRTDGGKKYHTRFGSIDTSHL